jgi:hypothetical protein
MLSQPIDLGWLAVCCLLTKCKIIYFFLCARLQVVSTSCIIPFALDPKFVLHIYYSWVEKGYLPKISLPGLRTPIDTIKKISGISKYVFLSGKKTLKKGRTERFKAVNNGHLVPWQRTQVAWNKIRFIGGVWGGHYH